MRTALISDIHANLEALETALANIRTRGIDTIFCLGDIINYGANPNECLSLTRRVSKAIIRGNHESALVSDKVAATFNPYARRAILWTRDQLDAEDRRILSSLPLIHIEKEWMMVHGTLEAPEEFEYLYDPADALRNFPYMSAPVCFYGHTHVPMLFSQKGRRALHLTAGKYPLEREDRYLINVGSIGQPRDHDPRLAYLVYDADEFSVELVRLNYDFKTTAAKIREAGLPIFLADRLGYGQ
ncbi:MAG: metallophosphoesterase family protein [Candidatus Omnitrophica bacterium]|nr:metallophosphoesterase family protein [Candidatus Omnitrophota bacterium]